MEQQYAVSLKGQMIGKVCVMRKGLYYHFRCRCNLPPDNIYRLNVVCGAIRESLGVLVPSGDEFVLNTKLPVKQLGTGKLVFSAVPKQEHSTGIFIPIRAEEPFRYISRLKQSFLILKDGVPGISVEAMQEC